MGLRSAVGALVTVGIWLAAAACAPNTPAEFRITDQVLRTAAKVPPLGANGWGRVGAVEWAANNFVHNPGNEPIHWRNLHRVRECGERWFEIDGPGTSWWDLWASGFLSGAEVRLYRLVDKAGQPLPVRADGNNLDLTNADHVTLVGTTRIVPEGTDGFPDGGWIANRYADVFPHTHVRSGNLSCTDAGTVQNGRAYWYTVVALAAGDVESDPAPEVSATPQAGADAGPRLLTVRDGDALPELRAGAPFDHRFSAVGRPPLQWAVEGALPDGLTLDAATGRLSGRPRTTPANQRLTVRVTDGQGRSDQRHLVLNAASASQGDRAKPQPPRAVTAVAGDGCVTVTWQPSPSANVVAYRLKRSTAPAAKQEQRVYLTPDAPPLRRWDYAVLDRRFDRFDMRWVNSRVRGIGNPMHHPGWYWNADLSRVSFDLVPHPQPVPAEMIDPGETCLQVTAAAGEQTIHQYTFIGTQRGGESLWYGQLEPGKRYRLEVWLRQEGLARGGEVGFSFGRGYPDLRSSFTVTDQWRRYTAEFAGPPRPTEAWHFGPQFVFTGPGKLFLDNCRVYRVDRPEDADAPYVPNATVLDELLRSQPERGPKGAHRIWFLAKDATMASILSWHAGSQVAPDWNTRVSGTMEMTLPMALRFDELTGPDATSRMRPWLVIQHLLHRESDWLALIEYLAAPYDPQRDTPQSKPWAWRRTQQRGHQRPWTDDFAELTIEFGNETWHNGVFADWLGFSTRNAVTQGGREYGLFTRYLIEAMQRSPYWQSAGLERKIRFNLGAFYNGSVDRDGQVRGYGEEAMQANPYAASLGHANYVGPKWETGDYAARQWDDRGVQECLWSFWTGPRASQARMAEAREQLARTHHAYDLTAYEGGPGGYALPGQAPREQVEVNERYGKSLAQAVGTLDAWLGSYAQGWTDQCFLAYGQGTHWNSHGILADGFRPSAAWLALTLRNRQAVGDLMSVQEVSVPSADRKGQTIPLVGAYAFRQGDRWTVFLLSRKLDGAAFGDGVTPVTLRLPFQTAAKVTLHALAGNPRETNLRSDAIKLTERELPANSVQGGTLQLAGGLPPGCVYGLVFEGAR